MDSSTYRHLLGQIKENSTFPHYYFPCHNLLSVETLLEVSRNLNNDPLDRDTAFLDDFPCYQPFPYAVQESFVLFCGSGWVDNAFGLVKKKLEWEKKLKNLRNFNINTAIKHIRNMRQNTDIKLSVNLKNYIENFCCDPEPMFSGYYNWLYTGGSLSHIGNCNGTILISDDLFAIKPGFNLLKLNNALDKIQYKLFCGLKMHLPILQITGKSRQENMIICVRQKNLITLFSMSEMNYLSQPVGLWKKKVLGSKILTCADVNVDGEEVIVTDSNYDLNIFSVERQKKIYGHSCKKIVQYSNKDCWSHIAFGVHGIYWTIRSSFCILDARDFYSGMKVQLTPSSATNSCESFCSFAQSPSDSNYVYLGTTHNVLQVDLRKGKPVQRWTHMMKNPPQFMASIRDEEEKELLVLQSQSVDEVSGILNERIPNGGNVNFVSKSLPCLLPNIKKSLDRAHSNGICLNPFFRKRVNFTVTGMQCLKNSQGDIVLLTKNSGGDIFLSRITKQTSNHCLEDKGEQKILDSMKMYESHFKKIRWKKSVKGHLKLNDMSHVVEGFKHGKVKTVKSKKLEIDWKWPGMHSLASLEFFKDFLAKRFLNVWGYSLEEKDFMTTMPLDEKILQWMEKD